jgi:hypothetical protein
MKDAYIQPHSSAHAEDQARISDLNEERDVTAADIGLTSSNIRALYAASPTMEAAALTRELYRLHGLLRRTAQFLDVACASGMQHSLDITSKTLLLGLRDALKREPAINWRLARAYSSTPQIVTCRSEAIGTLTPSRAAVAPIAIETHEKDTSPSGDQVGDRERLFTWKLLPEPGRGANVWQKGGYRGIVIVRAHDPVQARGLAAEKLIGNTAARTSRGDQINPWLRRSLVRIERMSDTTYDQIAVPEVVYP